MVEQFYDLVEDRKEVTSVRVFLAQFAKSEDIEEMFLKAVRETRLAGFKEGMKAALELKREVY
jgi:truncated hemoglobin YjbI